MWILGHWTTHAPSYKHPQNVVCIFDSWHYEILVILPVLLGHPIDLFFALCAGHACNTTKDLHFWVVWIIPQQIFLRGFHVKDGSDYLVVLVSYVQQCLAPKAYVPVSSSQHSQHLFSRLQFMRSPRSLACEYKLTKLLIEFWSYSNIFVGLGAQLHWQNGVFLRPFWCFNQFKK